MLGTCLFLFLALGVVACGKSSPRLQQICNSCLATFGAIIGVVHTHLYRTTSVKNKCEHAVRVLLANQHSPPQWDCLHLASLPVSHIPSAMWQVDPGHCCYGFSPVENQVLATPPPGSLQSNLIVEHTHVQAQLGGRWQSWTSSHVSQY